ncbi:hypothetical protein KFK09_011064 [Dendrobium nobile]|uniref:Uncharacterized protein n=1 Tax=Dendrobium nobile TaxID=94219 RepID=A0A8T3BBN6_DENNO|nr:hypothetical protein KFK09_011064 [Dendrobium nobile]
MSYIQGIIHFGIPILPSALQGTTFFDADWASDASTRCFTSVYCTYIGDTLISWMVKKLQTVTRSSIEAEYCALAATAIDVIWILRLLSDFHLPQSTLTDIHYENRSTIAFANNMIFHVRTKHIEVDFHFIHDHIQTHEFCFITNSTMDQLADILTKPLPTHRYHLLQSKLTVQPSPLACREVKTLTSTTYYDAQDHRDNHH